MAKTERFDELFTYLADKPALDVTEAMGFDPAVYQFRLATGETVEAGVAKVRVIGLVAGNTLGTSGGELRNDSCTELFSEDNTIYGAHVKYVEKPYGDLLMFSEVPEQSRAIADESAFIAIEQAIEAHKASIDVSPTELSLLDLAKVKSSELEEQMTQHAAQAEQGEEQKSLADQKMNAERELSRERADEFIALMKHHNIPTIDYYQTWEESDHEKARSRSPLSIEKNGYPKKTVNNLVGKGWIISQKQDGYFSEGGEGNFFAEGLVLLDSGLTYKWTGYGISHPTNTPNSIWQRYDAGRAFAPRDRLLASDEGFGLLAKYIAEKTDILTKKDDQSEDQTQELGEL